MREWLRGLLGRTKLDRIERLQREQMQAIAALGSAIVRLEQRFSLSIAKHQEQMAALAMRFDQLDAALAERDQLRQRLQEEHARVCELADQTGHLLTELGVERRALHDARARAEAGDDLRERCDTAERELGVVRRECDGLRVHTVRLDTACAAADRARAALEAELARVVRQRDDLLRRNEAAGAAS